MLRRDRWDPGLGITPMEGQACRIASEAHGGLHFIG